MSSARIALVLGLALLTGIAAGVGVTHALWGYWLVRPSVVDEALRLGNGEWSTSFVDRYEEPFHVRAAGEHRKWRQREARSCASTLALDCHDGRLLGAFRDVPYRQVSHTLVASVLHALGFERPCGTKNGGASCWMTGSMVGLHADAGDWIVVSVRSGEIETERVFVEAILRGAPDDGFEVVRSASYRFDTSGIERFDWRVVTPVVFLLAIGPIWIAMLLVDRLTRRMGRIRRIPAVPEALAEL